MRLLYATGNPAKLSAMQRRLEPLEIELYGLENITGKDIPEVEEIGNSPLENAGIKARAYYEALKVPLFSCDSGLYFDHVPEDIQPGIHVRNVNGRRLSDEEMITYYSGLAKRYGRLKARYRNAICLILDENRCVESMAENLSGHYFYIIDKPHEKRVPGFPLDSLAVDISSGKYYYDLQKQEEDQLAVDDGFCQFFSQYL